LPEKVLSRFWSGGGAAAGFPIEAEAVKAALQNSSAGRRIDFSRAEIRVPAALCPEFRNRSSKFLRSAWFRSGHVDCQSALPPTQRMRQIVAEITLLMLT